MKFTGGSHIRTTRPLVSLMSRVLIVDDQVLFADSLKIVLEGCDEHFTVIGIAANGREALEIMHEVDVDIVLMDIRMPELDGLRAAREIRKFRPGTRILMLTTYNDIDYAREAMESGVSGYLLKDVPADELIATIKQIRDDQIVFSREVVTRFVSADPRPSERPTDRNFLDELTPRELEILRLLSAGHTNAEIAGLSFLGEGTVKNYISSIYEKTGIHQRLKLIELYKKFTLARKLESND